MKKTSIIYGFLVTLLLLPLSLGCSKDLREEEAPGTEELACYPEGTPVTLYLPFEGTSPREVEVSTKGEASAIDEAHIHDIYVMIFNNGDPVPGTTSPRKIYGHFFSYEHQKQSLTELVSDENECWYAENKNIQKTITKTTGAVKISTIACNNATLVVVANVANAVMNLDGEDALSRLNAVRHLDELQGIEVRLEQDIVNRKDLFLMTGTLNEVGGSPLNTSLMKWGELAHTYNTNYKVTLTPVDAKVKFRVKVNSKYISDVTPVYWQVCNTPDRCYLDSSYEGGSAPDDINYFASQQYYFEGSETVQVQKRDPDTDELVYDEFSQPVMVDETWYNFCFYILENREAPNGTATEYYQRELQEKVDTGEPGYKGPNGPASGSFSDHFVENGNWVFAPSFGTYVRFDLVLTLTQRGIENISADEPDGISIGHALTSDAIFTVHLGDFDSSTTVASANLNNYQTLRGHSYTYNITVNNTKSIYTEVSSDNEIQSGQEGFLLLTDTEIINADAHYEYHQLEFAYRPDMKQNKFSWYVKTPFSDGGPRIIYDEDLDKFTYSAEGLDYLWVKFGINEVVGDDPVKPAHWDDDEDPTRWFSESLGTYVHPYSKRRHKYPGDSHYDPAWEPGQPVSEGVPVNYDPDRMVPDLMDITQLIQYIFYETAKETAYRQGKSATTSAFIADDAKPSTVPVLRFTAFINEFYYEEHPLEHTVDPDLWRKFVNAQPREMHILSDAQQSRDRKSDVILSSHSIIQQSIQSIYNIYAADLHTLWGTEHEDEMRKLTDGWPYWPGDDINGTTASEGRYGDYNTELGKWNGRLNSAYIWEFYSSKTVDGEDMPADWDTFLEYSVHNEIPELKAAGGGSNGYQGMAYSCLTRNRDNDGDGKVDKSEIRWYLAACNQLAGMWVGNESLSLDARLYRPSPNQWRAHIMSSTDKRVSWSEEGGGATPYSWDYTSSYKTWNTIGEAAKGESVRCLRNIGTYSDGGVIEDISYAPYDFEIEHYFTKEGPEPEGPFIFHFDRLNPKSIRQLSEGELPYADQFNQFNCVYLKFETQSRADNIGDTAEDRFCTINTVNNVTAKNPDNYPIMDSINPEVTQLGYNPYCPPGYRFPNHSEMLLMTMYLPKDYFEKNKNGIAYSGQTILPTRTYFDRGFYGDNRTGMTPAEVTNERGKIGWGYTSTNSKQSCLNKGIIVNHSRCVRDIDMTGYIDGDLILPSETLYPGDNTPLTCNFYSTAAAFVSASLKFCYRDGSGVYHEQDIPIQESPSGLQFRTSQTITIPTLSQLGLSDPSAANAKFKITVRNAMTSEEFEHPITLGNPLEGSISLNELASNTGKLYPGEGTRTVSFHITSKGNTVKLKSVSDVKLIYRNKDNNANLTQTLASISGPTQNTVKEFSLSGQSITVPILSTLELSDLPDCFDRDATLQVEAVDMGGSTITLSLPVRLENPLQGSIDIVDGFVYPLDNNQIYFNLSTASTVNLSSVDMSVRYTKLSDGAKQDDDITGEPSVSGSTSFESETAAGTTIAFPAATQIPDLTQPVTLIALITDEAGCQKTLTARTSMKSHMELKAGVLEIVKRGTTSPFYFPVQVTLDTTDPTKVVSGGIGITSAKLWAQKNNGIWKSVNLTTSTSAQTKTTTGDLGFSTFATGDYVNYKVEAVCADGTSVFSPVWSMEFLKYNYSPNGAKWTTDEVTGLNYGRGDYVEAQMTLQYKDNDSQKDGLICFGEDIDNYGNKGKNFQFYLGQKINDQQQNPPKLRMTGYNFADRLEKATDGTVNMCFSTGGLSIQGQDFLTFWSSGVVTSYSGKPLDTAKYNDFKSYLLGKSSITVGQREGDNRSYSTYDFIRAVRQYEITHSYDGDFDDPVDGGEI